MRIQNAKLDLSGQYCRCSVLSWLWLGYVACSFDYNNENT
jgi:hypothetical protein